MPEGLIPYNPVEYQQLVDQYANSFKQFRKAHPEMRALFRAPLDHLAVKSAGLDDFNEFIESLKPFCNELSYIELDGRKLATARLITPLKVGRWATTTLEIIQRKLVPSSNDHGLVGVEHVEFHHQFLDKVATVLGRAKVSYSHGGNAYHKTVEVLFNELGQEFKFTDKPLLWSVARQRQDGISTDIGLH